MTIHGDSGPEDVPSAAPGLEPAGLVVPVINYLVQESYDNAVAHGWWGEAERTFPELLALMHSELSEALEHFRDGLSPGDLIFTDGKPDGVPAELADVLIRIFDVAGHFRIPLAEALVMKLEYNRGRPYRHGGRVM